jgi:ketosteroid isomerase-like protein
MPLRLEDIELIKQLKYRYFRSIDMADLDTLQELFTDDVRVDYVGGTYRWQMQGKQQILAAIAAAFNPQTASCHTGHHPEITVHSESSATGLWYLTDVFINLADKVRTSGSALYRDQYLKVGGQWRIAVATYERIYEEVEHFTAPPQLTAHYLAKKLQR